LEWEVIEIEVVGEREKLIAFPSLSQTKMRYAGWATWEVAQWTFKRN
jgi:hypothetical protein